LMGLELVYGLFEHGSAALDARQTAQTAQPVR